jgi:hypothetical protein
MSAEKKLYNLEINPPQQVWDKLSASLDELQAEDIFKKKLQAVQSNPPANTWQNIESILDNENAENAVAEKLMNISVAPPAGLWNSIDTQLADEEFNKKFAGLSDLEVAPPAINWSSIAQKIEQPATVIPLNRRNRKVVRYAMAAAIIGLLVWGGISLFPGKNITAGENIANAETPKDNPISNAPVQNDNPVTPPNNTPSTTPLVKNDIEKNVAQNSKQQSKQSNNLPAPVLSFASSTTASESSHTGSEEIVADINALQKNKTPDGAMTATSSQEATRYLVYLNDDGEMMKVSKKLADMKCIYNKNGEVSQDALASINRQLCDDMVKAWQDKLSKAPINLSFNPLEMADILK